MAPFNQPPGGPPVGRDPLGDYMTAFAAGRAVAGASGPPPPPPAQGPVQTMDPVHQTALRRLQIIDAIAGAIAARTADPVERARMAQHFAANHPDMGVAPAMLTPQALSDPQIAALHQAVAAITGQAGGGPPGALTDDQLKQRLGL